MNKSPEFAEDYPAAHSMDTMWFAVDRDGNIAAFDSAEGGAVPNAALSDQEVDVVDAAAEIGIQSEVIHAHENHRYPLNTTYLHTQPYQKWREVKLPATGFWGRLLGGFRKSPIQYTTEPVEELELHLPLIMFFDKQSHVEPCSENSIAVWWRAPKVARSYFESCR